MNIIPVGPPLAVSLVKRFLGCPTCKHAVYDKGYGFVVCKQCDAIMLRRVAVVIEESIV